MVISKDILINTLEPLIQEWINAKRNLLENADYSDYITRDFFFYITTIPKPMGTYIIDAIDKELLSFDQHFIVNRLYREIIEIALTQQGCAPTESPYAGVDFEFVRDGKRYLVAMETPDSSAWGLEDVFGEVRHTLGLSFVPIVGSHRGIETYNDNEAFLYISGRRFWSLIAGDTFPVTVIEVVGEICRTVRKELSQVYGNTINRITSDTIVNCCNQEGEVLWEKIAYSDPPSYTKESH